MSLCALAFVSCQKEEMADNKPVDGKYTYTFTVSHATESKATVGDKTGTQWPVLWSAEDQLGVYGEGEFLGVATIDAASAGKNAGTFTLTTDAELSVGDELYFSYPYVEGAEMKTGKVAAEHTLTASGIGANGVAYAYVDYAGANTEFTLTHLNAYLKFNLLSSEDEDAFAGYDLQGVTLWAAGAELSGDVEVGNGDAVTYKGAGDYVKTTLAAPVKMGTTAQSVFLSALPCDLSDKTVYAIVHMTKEKETVTLPVLLKGAGNLPAGSVTDVTLPSLTKSLAPAWYEPVETRYIAAYGKGWSYGPENTVLFTEKNAVKKVDLKARGNFMKVKKPAYVQIQYAVDQSAGQKSGYVKYNGTTDAYAGSSYIDHEVDSDCTVSVAIAKVNSADVNGQISAMLVKDAGKNVIWGINLWACFNKIETVPYQNGAVMIYNIGSSVKASTYQNWKGNGVYFQWGRPWAFGWDANLSKNENNEKTEQQQTFEYTMTKPYTYFYYQGNPYNWFWDSRFSNGKSDINDLWGNPEGETKSGNKSIYDPCPKGYRVVSPAILAEVEDGLIDKVETETTPHYVLHNGVEWPFAGAFLGGASINSSGDRVISKSGNNNTTYMCAYWSNSNSGTNGRMMSYQPSEEEGKKLSTGRARAAALPVRCMVDTENR